MEETEKLSDMHSNDVNLLKAIAYVLKKQVFQNIDELNNYLTEYGCKMVNQRAFELTDKQEKTKFYDGERFDVYSENRNIGEILLFVNQSFDSIKDGFTIAYKPNDEHIPEIAFGPYLMPTTSTSCFDKTINVYNGYREVAFHSPNELKTNFAIKDVFLPTEYI
jgi:hypothetical protein